MTTRKTSTVANQNTADKMDEAMAAYTRALHSFGPLAVTTKTTYAAYLEARERFVASAQTRIG